MNKYFFTPVLALSVGLLTACQTQAPRDVAAVAAEPPAKVRALPFNEPQRPQQELDEDLVFSYLAGEIGTRAGELRTALVHYLHASMLADDPYAAERATRIALHLHDYEQGMRAAKRWVQLAPNSLSARQISGLLFLRNGELDMAREQFDAVMRIAEALDKDGMLQVAVALSNESDQEAALQVMRGLLAEHDGDARSYYAMSVIEAAQERYQEAESSLREAIALDPERPQPRVLLSRVLVALGRTEQAIRHLAAAVKDYPDSRLLRISYARLLVSEQLFSEALQQFRVLYKQAPEDVEIAYGFAMLATQQEQWDEARSLWQALRNRLKYRDEATYFLAQVEEQADNTELALGLYRSIPPGEFKVDAVIRMSGLLADIDQLAEARQALAQARIAYAERAVDLYLAEAQVMQLAQASHEDVMALYRQAVSAHPDNNVLLYNRGLYLSQVGDYTRMEADFQAVLARDPDNVDALNALGYMLAEQNTRLDEAFDYVSRALAQQPDSPAILDSMGWVYYRMGDFANALKYLRQAVAETPDGEISAHLGEVLWVSGRQDEARSVWREALREMPDSEELRAVMERFLEP